MKILLTASWPFAVNRYDFYHQLTLEITFFDDLVVNSPIRALNSQFILRNINDQKPEFALIIGKDEFVYIQALWIIMVSKREVIAKLPKHGKNYQNFAPIQLL